MLFDALEAELAENPSWGARISAEDGTTLAWWGTEIAYTGRDPISFSATIFL